jgi:hypothetical protein
LSLLFLLMNETNSAVCCHDHCGRDLDIVETDASTNSKSQDFFGFFSVNAFDFRLKKSLVRQRGEKDVQSFAMVLKAADGLWRKVLENDKHLCLGFNIFS